MLEKIKNDPEMVECERVTQLQKNYIKKRINQVRKEADEKIIKMKQTIIDLTKKRNQVAAKLYKRYYTPAGRKDWYKNNECYKLFGKRKKELTPQELKQYNNIMADKRRGRLIK